MEKTRLSTEAVSATHFVLDRVAEGAISPRTHEEVKKARALMETAAVNGFDQQSYAQWNTQMHILVSWIDHDRARSDEQFKQALLSVANLLDDQILVVHREVVDGWGWHDEAAKS